MMKFKAAIMDFDGTVTKKGSISPSEKMIKKLVALAGKVPIAFCTGRQLESFQKRGLSVILKAVPRAERKKILGNIFLLGENGSIGYFYDQKSGKYKEFYRAKWPDEFIKKSELKKMLADKVSKYGELINVHRVIVVMRAHNLDDVLIADVYKRSSKMFKICDKALCARGKNYEKFLHLGDSGIGVIVCPAGGDKDTGIKKFAEYLARKRGMKFGKNLREILVIGDSAKKTGNDYYFLRGKYGTPFTVGYYSRKNKYPFPVLDKNNKRLLYDKGTLHLLEHFLPF